MWPSSWNARSRLRTAANPRWMSEPVGSSPSLPRSGRPSFSFASSAPSGRTSTALRVSSAIPTAPSLEVGDLEGLELVGRLEAEDLPDEGELGLESTPDVLALAEAVALALEREVRVRDALLVERGDHHLRLARRHDLVVEPLQQQHRTLEAFGEGDRRTGPVEIRVLRVPTDERGVVARLELVRLGGERLHVGDAEVTDARG